MHQQDASVVKLRYIPGLVMWWHSTQPYERECDEIHKKVG